MTQFRRKSATLNPVRIIPLRHRSQTRRVRDGRVFRFGLKRGERVGAQASDLRAAEKKIGCDVEEVAQLRQLFVAAFEDASFVALIDGLRDAEIRGDLRLRHSVGDATFLHSVSYQHFKRHLDKIIRIVYDEDAHIYSYCI